MRIQCTKKLLDRMKISAAEAKKAGETSAAEDFFCWHANVITLDRRKALIFVNNSTRLTVIAYRPKPSAYKNPGEILETGIRELFTALGIHDDVTEQYLQKAGSCLITTSGTRSQIARMNKMAEGAAWQSLFFREDKVLQTTASVELANDVFAEGKELLVPEEQLFELLCRMINVSETEWDIPNTTNAFIPNVYVDITKYIDRKIAAMEEYKTQICHYPNPRSIQGIRALAMLRGTTISREYAEAFMLIREIR